MERRSNMLFEYWPKWKRISKKEYMSYGFDKQVTSKEGSVTYKLEKMLYEDTYGIEDRPYYGPEPQGIMAQIQRQADIQDEKIKPISHTYYKRVGTESVALIGSSIEADLIKKLGLKMDKPEDFITLSKAFKKELEKRKETKK